MCKLGEKGDRQKAGRCKRQKGALHGRPSGCLLLRHARIDHIDGAHLGIGAIAVLLDLLVRYLNRRGVSHHLCWLLDKTVLLLAAIDCSLVLAIAACNAWEARPMVMRAHGPGAAVEVATSGTTRR